MVKNLGFLQQINLFSYFIGLFVVGSILLVLPISWAGAGSVKYIDALFTAVSASCVTGLATLDTSQWSRFGQVIIMLLIQFGGLGIITFTSFLLAMPRKKWSMVSHSLVNQYTINAVEGSVKRVIFSILGITLTLELIGAIFLAIFLPPIEGVNPIFNGIFHSISAFCNAGFSLYPLGMEEVTESSGALIVIMFLVVFGGIGFVVFRDLFFKFRGYKKQISVHTVLVLATTALLIILPAFSFFLVERNELYKEFNGFEKWVHAFFQSVTTRTAGFNTVPQGELTSFSHVLTVLLMFIGGGSASMAGGIKVTTFAIIVLSITKGLNHQNNVVLRKREISTTLIARAYMLAMKSIFLVGFAVFALSITEDFALGEVLFETVSAFGTVGLSTGITPNLSSAGKIILVFTMFAGRVGLVSMTLSLSRSFVENVIKYPKGEVLIG